MNAVAERECYGPGREPGKSAVKSVPSFVPLLAFSAVAILVRNFLPAWVFMWVIALALFAGSKWLVYCDEVEKAAVRSVRRSLGFLLGWPGMDARRFLSNDGVTAKPGRKEWIAAIFKTLAGVLIVWRASRVAMPQFPMIAGWIGMTGLILLLHFGTFQLLFLVWRAMGVNAMPLMRSPLRSKSLGEFWGRRWNTAFHELTMRFAFRPLQARVGPSSAMLIVFLLSGFIHELVITFPARGGYGLPTGYFMIQGLGMVAERSRLGQRIGLGGGRRGWLITLLIVAAPAYFLFPPIFIHRVILPMLKAMGAI
jgi:hypothetical protein